MLYSADFLVRLNTLNKKTHSCSFLCLNYHILSDACNWQASIGATVVYSSRSTPEGVFYILLEVCFPIIILILLIFIVIILNLFMSLNSYVAEICRSNNRR